MFNVEASKLPFLRSAQPEDFLPPISAWLTIGGLTVLAGLMGAIALSAVLKYKIVVKAPAVVRPTGELRLVQSGITGKVSQIYIRPLQKIRQGEILAVLEDTRWQIQQQQLQNQRIQTQQQLQQIQLQLEAIDREIVAEKNQNDRILATAQADLKLNQRLYQERQVTTQAELQEAEAALSLSQDELDRYRQLSNTGAIAVLQLREKEAAVKIAQAKVNRTKIALNPSDAEVEKAQERMAQVKFSGNARMARLTQEREQRLQQRRQLEAQLTGYDAELKLIASELENTVLRAPIAGIIQDLSLRNPNQVVNLGDTIARIVPSDDALVIKAQVPIQDIGKLAIQQPAQIRIAACPYPDYGTLDGTVQAISPDVVTSDRSLDSQAVQQPTNQGIYIVTIQPQTTALKTSKSDCVIQAGMTGRVDIVLGEETVLEFFLRKARLIADSQPKS